MNTSEISTSASPNVNQTLINGRQGSKAANLRPTINYPSKGHEREEFSDWPHGFLAIGTFGNEALKEDPKGHNLHDASSPTQEFTPEEFGQLQKELNLLFSQENISVKPIPYTDEEHCDPPVGKFLHCSPNSQADKRCGQMSCSDTNQEESDHLQNSISVIQNKGKDVCLNTTGNAIGKKSLSFLLKQMFVCRSGFAPAPSYKDPLAHSESRMEKLLRKVLKKKVYPQCSSPIMLTKRYLPRRQESKTENSDDNNDNCNDNVVDENHDKGNDGSKWVKTDTEYIILEIYSASHVS
ncbi:hypothetical protein Ancab_027593 [Ancistrocladus abbreviatus]